MSWLREAECQGEDPELFFPIGSAAGATFQIADAKQICARCPVRDKCLEWALVIGVEYGVWGGLSEDERRTIRRRIARSRLSARASLAQGLPTRHRP